MKHNTIQLLGTSDLTALGLGSRATIARREKTDPDFPKPIVINGRKYRTAAQMEEYIERKAQQNS